MGKFFKKRSKILFISACIGLFYLIYLISHFYVGVTTTDGAEQVGAAIATALVTPHMILIGVAVIFNWLGVFLKKNWMAMVSGILYGVGGVMFIIYIWFVIPMIVLSFVGFAKQKKLNNEDEEDIKPTKTWQYIVMAIIIILTGIVYLTAGGTSDTDNNDIVNTEENAEEKNTSEYKLGDLITVEDESGKYEVTFEKVRTTKERNEFSEITPKTVIFIDYNYRNVSYKDDVYISSMSMKVMDGEGNVLDTYPVSDDTRQADSVPLGGKSKATEAYAITSDSKEITILFYNNMFNDEPTAKITTTIK